MGVKIGAVCVCVCVYVWRAHSAGGLHATTYYILYTTYILHPIYIYIHYILDTTYYILLTIYYSIPDTIYILHTIYIHEIHTEGRHCTCSALSFRWWICRVCSMYVVYKVHRNIVYSNSMYVGV
jgi:hypothetical protein